MTDPKRKILFALFLITLVDVLGYAIVLPLLPFYAQDFGGTPMQIGWLFASFAVCQFLSGPVLGRLSDVRGRKPVLIFSQIGSIVGFVLLALAPNLAIVFLARIIDGLTAGNLTVVQASIADNTEPHERTRAFGLIGIAYGIGYLVGPLLGGLLSTSNHSVPVWVAAALALVSIVSSQLFLPKSERHVGTTKRTQTSRRTTREALRHPQTRTWLGVYFAFNLSFSIFMSGLALFAERHLSWGNQAFGTQHVGWTYALLALVGLVVQALLLEKLTKIAGTWKVLLGGFALQALGYGLFVAVRHVPGVATATILAGLGVALVRPTVLFLLSSESASEDQGFIYGLSQSAAAVATIVGPLASGALIESPMEWSWPVWAAAPAAVGLIVALVMQGQARTPRSS